MLRTNATCNAMFLKYIQKAWCLTSIRCNSKFGIFLHFVYRGDSLAKLAAEEELCNAVYTIRSFVEASEFEVIPHVQGARGEELRLPFCVASD